MSYFELIKGDTVNNYYLYSVPEIALLRKRLDIQKTTAYQKDMEVLFAAPPESVTSRTKPSPSGDPHDYVSLATYWWPNKETPDGLPYVRKDGFANPEGTLYDKDKLKRLAYLVYNGALLYFLTEETRYLDLIKKHLYNWFINEETRMNPHMEYGQFIPGICNGRGEGIIDYGASFSYALNMISLLREQNLLESELLDGLMRWHQTFHSWLIKSEIARHEESAENNHGIFFDFSLSVIELFLGMHESIQHRASWFVRERLEKQIAPDFSLPHETGRTRSVNYCFMAIKGMLELAKMYKSLGFDFFPRLKGTVDWVYNSLILHRDNWPYAQVTPFDEGICLVFREMANEIYGGQYRDIVDHVPREKIMNQVLNYLYYY